MNPGPSACEADVIPLHHVTLDAITALHVHGARRAGEVSWLWGEQEKCWPPIMQEVYEKGPPDHNSTLSQNGYVTTTSQYLPVYISIFSQAQGDSSPKIAVTPNSPVGDISAATLIRTDTTLDHSQQAEKRCSAAGTTKAPNKHNTRPRPLACEL